MKLKIFLLLFLFLFTVVYSDEQNYKQQYDECVVLRRKIISQNSDLKFNNILIFYFVYY